MAGVRAVRVKEMRAVRDKEVRAVLGKEVRAVRGKKVCAHSACITSIITTNRGRLPYG